MATASKKKPAARRGTQHVDAVPQSGRRPRPRKPLSDDASKLVDTLQVGAAVISKNVKIIGEGGNVDNLGAELAAVFARHGITVTDVSIGDVAESSASVIQQHASFAMGQTAGASSDGEASMKVKEVPHGLGCLGYSIDAMLATVHLLEERLEAAGVLGAVPAGTGETEGRVEPSAPIAKRILELERHVNTGRGALRALIDRLEA